jgi:hypothetical protein
MIHSCRMLEPSSRLHIYLVWKCRKIIMIVIADRSNYYFSYPLICVVHPELEFIDRVFVKTLVFTAKKTSVFVWFLPKLTSINSSTGHSGSASCRIWIQIRILFGTGNALKSFSNFRENNFNLTH